MTEGENEWLVLFLALLVLPGVIVYNLQLRLWHKFKLTVEKDSESESSSVDPPDIAVNKFGSKRVINRIQVNVSLINGECHVENGDTDLSVKCNRVLSEMNAFQREFLTISPQGKPNKMVFNEVILQDENGFVERKAYFESLKEEESFRQKFWKKFKGTVSS